MAHVADFAVCFVVRLESSTLQQIDKPRRYSRHRIERLEVVQYRQFWHSRARIHNRHSGITTMSFTGVFETVADCTNIASSFLTMTGTNDSRIEVNLMRCIVMDYKVAIGIFVASFWKIRILPMLEVLFLHNKRLASILD